MRPLFPDIKPYATQRFAVDDLHTLYVEECGNPRGLPALFLHGRGDRRVSVAESRRIFDAAPAPKAYKEFENVGHQSCFQRCPEAWAAEVADFLKSAGILRP